MDLIRHGLDWLNGGPPALEIGAVALAVFAFLSIIAAAAARSHRASRSQALHGHTNLASSANETADDRRHGVRPQGGHEGGEEKPRLPSGLRRRVANQPFIHDNLLFLSRWINAPLKMGAVAPSSRSLGRAMAAQLPADYQVCVELGGGTGSLTRSLLEAGVPPERLIVLERDPQLAAHLRSRFPQVRVIQGNAAQLVRILRSEGIGQVDAIMSSLPLVSMPARLRQRIAAESFAALKPDGVFVQFTYGFRPPIPQAVARRLRFNGELKVRIWQNLPPAAVWSYRHQP